MGVCVCVFWWAAADKGDISDLGLTVRGQDLGTTLYRGVVILEVFLDLLC